MKPTTTIAAAGLGLALAIGIAARAPRDLPEVGTTAPEIAAKTWYNHIGLDPNLESLRGKAILLEFWATW